MIISPISKQIFIISSTAPKWKTQNKNHRFLPLLFHFQDLKPVYAIINGQSIWIWEISLDLFPIAQKKWILMATM